MDFPEIKISELAERVGVSVRALHYYDEIGLLRPTRHTPAGHRRYGHDDLIRLDQIRSLQEIGLSLEQIRESLGQKNALRRRMEHRLADARQELTALQHRVDSLEVAVSWLQKDRSLDANDAVRVLQHVTIYHRYFTPSQREQIEQHLRAIDDVGYVRGRAAWNKCLAAIRWARAKGMGPADPIVQEQIRDIRRLVIDFTSGNRRLQRALIRMYHGEPRFRERRGIDGPLYEFLRAAYRWCAPCGARS